MSFGIGENCHGDWHPVWGCSQRPSAPPRMKPTAKGIVTMTVTVRPVRENHQPISALWRFEQGQDEVFGIHTRLQHFRFVPNRRHESGHRSTPLRAKAVIRKRPGLPRRPLGQ